MTSFKGNQNTNFAQVATPGGETGEPVPKVFSKAPICDQFGRLILRVDGIVNTAASGDSSVADTTTWLGTSLNAGPGRNATDGFHNIITLASSDTVSAVTKIFGYNNASSPGYAQLWFSNDLTAGSGSKELALVQPVASVGSFVIDAFIPFHIFGGSLWLYLVLVFSAEPLNLAPLPFDSLWATWNYISKNPYP
jgi:hypothetical protein